MEQPKSPLEKTAFRGHSRLVKHLGETGVVIVGAMAGFGIANAKGFESEIGPDAQPIITASTHLGTGDHSISYKKDTFSLKSSLPIGARVEVKNFSIDGDEDTSQLPLAQRKDEFFSADNRDKLDDILPYLQDTEAIKHIVSEDIAEQGVPWAIGGAAAAALLLGLSRSDKQSKLKLTSVSTAALAIVSVPVISHQQNNDMQSLSFYGQTLSAFQADGPAIEEAQKYINSNEAYYNSIDQAVEQALKPVYDEDKERGDTAWLFMTDQHCNMGMYQTIETVTKQLDINTILNAGDETMSTQASDFCFAIRAERLDSVENKINVLGNHDNNASRQQYEANHETVLNGETITVDGLTVAGYSDPTYTPLRQDTIARGSESRQDFQRRIDEGVRNTRPDITLLHNPKDARVVSPNTTLSLSGHTHQAKGPIKAEAADHWEYTGGSSGGHDNDHITQVQRLAQDASLLIIYSSDGQITGTREIRITPSTEVSVSEFEEFDYDNLSAVIPTGLIR